MKNVLIIGGGATGAGIAAEAAGRGFAVTLIERGSLGAGTSGSFHGMLHSGARYALKDVAVAAACYTENQRLRQIIPSAIVDTNGLFVAMTEEEAQHADKLIVACKQAGILVKEISAEQALQAEPKLSSSLLRAIRVPDATIDGQEVLRLSKQSALDAKAPAIFMTNHEVVSLQREGDTIKSVSVRSLKDGRTIVLPCDYLINAAGVWAGEVAKMADQELYMTFDKGTMVVLQKQLTKTIINRCRPESDGDLLVPFDGHTILGTTARVVVSPDDSKPTQEEVTSLVRECSELVPEVATTEFLQVYAGVRPLFREVDVAIPASSRLMSRSFKVIDHTTYGLRNMMSIVGGKVTLYQLMAEQAVDLLQVKTNSF